MPNQMKKDDNNFEPRDIKVQPQDAQPETALGSWQHLLATLSEAQRISRSGSWAWNLATGEITFSEGMFMLTGMNPGTMNIDRDAFKKILHPDEADRVLTEFLQSNEIPHPVVEHRIMLPHDGVIDARTYIKVHRDEHGDPLSLIGSTHDITEQKRTELALVESVRHFHSLFDNTTIGMYRTTPDGRILLANQAGVRLLGYDSSEEMQRRNLASEGFFKVNERNVFLEKMARDGFVVGLESTWIKKDGSVIHVRESATAVKDDDGNILYYDGTFEDVTERKAAEDALKESEDRTRTVTDMITDYIFVVDVLPDHSMKMRWASENMQRLTGRTVDEMLTSDLWTDIIHPEDKAAYLRFVKDTLATARSNECECRTYQKGGAERWVKIFVQPKINENGVVDVIVGAIQDISRRKRIELTLEKNLHLLAETERMGNVGGWELNIEESEFHWTDQVYRIHELDKSKFTPKLNSVLTLYKPKYRMLINDTVQSAIIYGGRFDAELELFPRSGGYKWIHLVCEAERHSTRVFGFFQDITERKRAETEREVLLGIMQGLTLTNELRDYFELIHFNLSKVIFAENFFIILYNKETHLFEELYSVDKFDPPMSPSKLEKSITAYVFRTGEPLLLSPAKFDELIERGEIELVGTRTACWLGAPLKTPTGTIGVIAVQDYNDQFRYSERDKEFLSFISAQIAVAIERKSAEQKLAEARASLRLVNLGLEQALIREQHTSRTDSLTDVHNRRHFFEIADHEFIAANRFGKILSMILFDIDHFKKFNDIYGHLAGDEILKHVVRITQMQLRDTDILARYGGEEFVILLPGNNARSAVVVAERIRENIASYLMDFNQDKVGVTVSMGVAECDPGMETLDELVRLADKAMYVAKDAGRNRVISLS